MQDNPLNGQIALVTGANSGIGEEVALALGRAGAAVAVNYIVRPEAAQTIVNEIKNACVEAIALKAMLATKSRWFDVRGDLLAYRSADECRNHREIYGSIVLGINVKCPSIMASFGYVP